MSAEARIQMLEDRVSVLERILIRNPRALKVKAQTNQEAIVEKAQQFCAVWFNVKQCRLTEDCREQKIVWPRWVAIHLSRKFTRLGIVAIAKMFKKDHASISHATRAIANEMATSHERRRQVEEIEKEFAALIQPSTESQNATAH